MRQKEKKKSSSRSKTESYIETAETRDTIAENRSKKKRKSEKAKS